MFCWILTISYFDKIDNQYRLISVLTIKTNALIEFPDLDYLKKQLSPKVMLNTDCLDQIDYRYRLVG